MDVKVVPKKCYTGELQDKFYQYTVIDEASRERFIFPYKEQSSYSTIDFIKRSITYFGYKPKIIQTDNGQPKSKKDDMLETVKSVMPIAVAVLLAISIAVQCVMVSRIGELEQAQTRVNQVLLKGDNAGQ